MPALVRCPSRPCHNDDIGISTKNKSPSLSVTYKGDKECTFGPLASRRFPQWSVHPPDENSAWMPQHTSRRIKIEGPHVTSPRSRDARSAREEISYTNFPKYPLAHQQFK